MKAVSLSLFVGVVYLFHFVQSSNVSHPSIIQPGYDLEDFEYKGVSLGGWLVLEPYITPSLFLEFNSSRNSSESDIPVDEYHYCQRLGADEAQTRLTRHWDTWYTKRDFEAMKSYGINMVRVPIGYWAFERLPHDPYVTGAERYLDRAIEWADEYDLKVMIDLHGLPGSQNGFDNSGFRDINYPGWFNSSRNVDLSYRVLDKIFTKYGNSNFSSTYGDVILGVELVNEPLGSSLSMRRLRQFYQNAYHNARDTSVLNNTIFLQEAFQPIGYWNSFMEYDNMRNATVDYYNILIDHHHYEIFSPDALMMSIDEHLDSVKSYGESIVEEELDHHPAIVGEWSAALTDCTPWLNGVGLGTRWEGTSPYDNDQIGDCSSINDWDSWNSTMKKDTRKFIEMQLQSYGNATGWIFWCFKTETSIEWDFQRLVNLGLMPQPLDNYTYIKNGIDTEGMHKKSASTKISVNCSLAIIWVVVVAVLL